MVVLAAIGGIILILAVALTWQDRRARRRGPRIQYRWDRIRQERLNTEVNYACQIPARHKPDGMSEGQGDQVDPLFSPVAGSEWARERSRRRPGVRAG